MRRYLIAAGFFAGLFLWMNPVAAEDKELAKRHFQNGKAMWGAGNYEAAAQEFEHSIQYYMNKNNLYELAHCYLKLGRDIDAYKTFEQSQAMLRAHIEKKGQKSPNDEKMAQDIEEQMKTLEARLALLTVSTTPEGATVKVDQMDELTTGLDGSIILEPGVHSVEVSLDGYETDVRQITAAAGTQPTLALILKTSPAMMTEPAVTSGTVDAKEVEPQESAPAPLFISSSSPNTNKVTVDNRPDWHKPLFIGSLAGTVAMAGVATAMWTIRGRKINDYNAVADDLKDVYVNNDRDPDLVDQAENDKSSAEKFHNAALATTIATGVFAAVLATSVVLMKNGKEQRPVSVSPTLGGMRVCF